MRNSGIVDEDDEVQFVTWEKFRLFALNLQDSIDSLKDDVLSGQKKLENLLSSVASTMTTSRQCVSQTVGDALTRSETFVGPTQTTITSFISQSTPFNHSSNEEEVLKWISGKMEGVTIKDVFYKWYAYKIYSLEPPVDKVKTTYSWNSKAREMGQVVGIMKLFCAKGVIINEVPGNEDRLAYDSWMNYMSDLSSYLTTQVLEFYVKCFGRKCRKTSSFRGTQQTFSQIQIHVLKKFCPAREIVDNAMATTNRFFHDYSRELKSLPHDSVLPLLRNRSKRCETTVGVSTETLTTAKPSSKTSLQMSSDTVTKMYCVGIRNKGNSCYINCWIQCFASLMLDSIMSCPVENDFIACLKTELRKYSLGLNSNDEEYSFELDSNTLLYFSYNGDQQDCLEMLNFPMNVITDFNWNSQVHKSECRYGKWWDTADVECRKEMVYENYSAQSKAALAKIDLFEKGKVETHMHVIVPVNMDKHGSSKEPLPVGRMVREEICDRVVVAINWYDEHHNILGARDVYKEDKPVGTSPPYLMIQLALFNNELEKIIVNAGYHVPMNLSFMDNVYSLWCVIIHEGSSVGN